MKEYLKIYDENNQDSNEIKERTLVHELGLWHREIEVWIINEKNEVLIQQRSPNKKLGANKWSIVAGHVPADESLIETAIREVQEEVGIKKVCPSDLVFFNIRKANYDKGEIKNNCYKYCYILKTNLKENDFVLQEDEVSKIKYIKLDKLKTLTSKEKEEFTASFRSSEFKSVIEKLENKLKDLEEE